jgi:hypothetical protein
MFEEMSKAESDPVNDKRSKWALIYRHIKVPPQFQKLKDIIDKSQHEKDSVDNQQKDKEFQLYFSKQLECLKLQQEQLDLKQIDEKKDEELDAKSFFAK